MMKTLVRILRFTAAVTALHVDLDSLPSIQAAAATKAQDAMSFYHGNQPGDTPGTLPDPYFWWQAGALWGTMIDYWKYTGDTQYNDITQQALLFQVGPDQNYLPPNVTRFIGNDDQGFWAMSAILAAETGFQDPGPSEPQWLSLALAVYNVQKGLLDQETACGGGLRWQVLVYNNGYDYKNSVSNAVFFNVAARLAHYTGKAIYSDNAISTFQWLRDVGLIDEEYNVWDGGHVQYDCKDTNHKQTSYLPAVLLQGAAFMWSSTKDEFWKTQVDRLLDSLLKDFVIDGVLYEPGCDSHPNPSKEECTPDMPFYKGFVLRWMADTVALCPWTRESIEPVIRASAKAALDTCTGGATGRMCGRNWQKHQHDGDAGLGQEMSAFSALMTVTQFSESEEQHSSNEESVGTFVVDSEDQDPDSSELEPTKPSQSSEGGAGHVIAPPRTHDNGGTSVGDENAGKETRKTRPPRALPPIKRGDTVGASTLTALFLLAFWSMLLWMLCDGADPWKERSLPEDEEMQASEVNPGSRIPAQGEKTPLDRAADKKHDRGKEDRGQPSGGSRGSDRPVRPEHRQRTPLQSARPQESEKHKSRPSLDMRTPQQIRDAAMLKGLGHANRISSHAEHRKRRHSHTARIRSTHDHQPRRTENSTPPQAKKGPQARSVDEQGESSGSRQGNSHARPPLGRRSQSDRSRGSSRAHQPRNAEKHMPVLRETIWSYTATPQKDARRESSGARRGSHAGRGRDEHRRRSPSARTSGPRELRLGRESQKRRDGENGTNAAKGKGKARETTLPKPEQARKG